MSKYINYYLFSYTSRDQFKMKIFISYAREDIKIANKLWLDLTKNGFYPWLDQKELLPGQNWKAMVSKAIEECTYFLALLSKDSVSKKGYVQKELKKAMDILDEYPYSETFLIPVRLDDCKPMDYKIKDLHWGDLFPSYNEGLEQILKVLNRDEKRFIDLARDDHPLMRKLLIAAPGTYHHSIIVGVMAKSAAPSIGVHPALARACGYFHDIGKLENPEYYIENTRWGDESYISKDRPLESAKILISHVSKGVKIARKNSIDEIIINAIKQHHGTSVIKYFYEQEKKLKGGDSVDIDNFRYKGPKPQTRVAALTMIAQVIEAAYRTLDNPTPPRIQGLIQHLINMIFSDGQLDECDLTLKDLHNIAKSFAEILNAISEHKTPENLR